MYLASHQPLLSLASGLARVCGGFLTGRVPGEGASGQGACGGDSSPGAPVSHLGVPASLGLAEASRRPQGDSQEGPASDARARLASPRESSHPKASHHPECEPDRGAQPALGDRCHKLLDGAGVGGDPGGDRLLHPPDRGAACEPARPRSRSGGGLGDGVSARVWLALSQRRRASGAAKRQRKIFTSKKFQGRCKQYGLSQEFIHALHPATERHDRAILSLAQGGMHLAPPTSKASREAKGAIEDWVEFYNTLRPHQALKYRSPTSIGLSLIIRSRGLTFGGHYSTPVLQPVTYPMRRLRRSSLQDFLMTSTARRRRQ